MKLASKFYLVVIFAILYIPLIYLAYYSFNSGKTMIDFEGFSWDERLQEVLPGAVLCQDDILWFVDQEAYEGAALRQG